MSAFEKTKLLSYGFYPNLGCDPEFFFVNKNNKIVESNQVIPKTGFGFNSYYNGTKQSVICDGVQAELNPNPSTCRAALGRNIAVTFKQIKEQLLKDGVKASFTGVVKFSPEEMKQLSEDSKKFGCKPSNNMYSGGVSVIPVDPAEYRYRSAGGHIHIGTINTGNNDEFLRCLHKKSGLTVRCLDMICGNTFVLIDRDPMQAERRKVYGRAGEYRKPDYGIEYRTLSNCWLRSYQLYALAMGLARLGVIVAYNIYMDEKKSGKKDSPIRKGLMHVLSKKQVETAINKNDYDLALENWNAIKDFVINDLVGENCKPNDKDWSLFPIGKQNIKEFDFFIEKIQEKGLEYWFPEDPIEHWSKITEGHGIGFECWSKYHVAKVMNGYVPDENREEVGALIRH